MTNKEVFILSAVCFRDADVEPLDHRPLLRPDCGQEGDGVNVRIYPKWSVELKVSLKGAEVEGATGVVDWEGFLANLAASPGQWWSSDWRDTTALSASIDLVLDDDGVAGGKIEHEFEDLDAQLGGESKQSRRLGLGHSGAVYWRIERDTVEGNPETRIGLPRPPIAVPRRN